MIEEDKLHFMLFQLVVEFCQSFLLSFVTDLPSKLNVTFSTFCCCWDLTIIFFSIFTVIFIVRILRWFPIFWAISCIIIFKFKYCVFLYYWVVLFGPNQFIWVELVWCGVKHNILSPCWKSNQLHTLYSLVYI